MEFSEIFDGTRAIFSPDGQVFACVCGDFVEIRFASTLLKAFKFECGGSVKDVRWSGDSSLLLCHVGVATLKVFSTVNGSCTALLRQKVGSINQLGWSSDNRTVFFVESFLLRASVWRLSPQLGEAEIIHIDNVQPWAEPGVALSPNGKHLALVLCGISVAETPAGSSNATTQTADKILIFSAISWRKEEIINLKGICRVRGITWSPNSSAIVVWSSDQMDLVQCVCVRTATVIGRWQSSAKLWAGVSSLRFSPSGQFASIVGHNSKVHIINCIAWCEEIELVHNQSVIDSNCRVFQLSPSSDLEDSQHFQWDPIHNILAVVDGGDSVCIWNADLGKATCASICSPVSRLLFQARHLNWCYDGRAILASSDLNSTVLELSFR